MSCKSEATHVIHLLDLQYLLKSFPNFQDIIFNRNFRSQLIDYKHKYSPLDSNKTLFSSLRHAKKPNPFHIHYTQPNTLNKNTKNSKKISQILSASLFTIIFIRVSNCEGLAERQNCRYITTGRALQKQERGRIKGTNPFAITTVIARISCKSSQDILLSLGTNQLNDQK